MAARLVLLSCILVLAACQTSLKPHLSTSPEDLTVFRKTETKQVRTSLRFTKEDISQFTSFPDSIQSNTDEMAKESFKFQERTKARPWGGRFDNLFGDCDPCCRPAPPPGSFDHVPIVGRR